MNAEQFIQQQVEAGCKIHFHQGIWWQKVGPLFCKPALPFQKIVPGSLCPKSIHALFGYSHLVAEQQLANKSWPVLLLKQETLKNYGMKSISSKKRNQVRKGLRELEVKRIERIEPVIDSIKTICVSAAERTGHGKPPEYYENRYVEWRTYIKKEFAFSGREWWGAFYENALIAYFYGYPIEETMVIAAAKSHTAYLDKCPNDALLFTFLEYCKTLEDCQQVVFGDWSAGNPSLNTFKQKYGFEKVDLPVYAKYNPFIAFFKEKVYTNPYLKWIYETLFTKYRT